MYGVVPGGERALARRNAALGGEEEVQALARDRKNQKSQKHWERERIYHVRRARPVFDTIRWEDDAVVLIDQRVLPTREEYVRCRDAAAVAGAIRDMVVRGAPAIGVTAAMGIALGLKQSRAADARALRADMESLAGLLAATRPTAVNLFWAIDRMKRKFEELLPEGVEATRAGMEKEAISIHREDIEMNRRMGAHGEKLLKDGARILTHCNAGALATAGYGTALGMMRAPVDAPKRISVFSDETR